jgi:hypothetical protein
MTLTHQTIYRVSVGNVLVLNQGESNMPGYGMSYGKKAMNGKKKKKPMMGGTKKKTGTRRGR